MANQIPRKRARAVTPTGGPHVPASALAGASPELRDLADGLHSVAIHLLRRLRREDERMGLSPARASVLSVLVFGGARSVGELAQAEQVSAPTMSRMLAGMERAKLVRRRRHPGDARAVRVEATAAGRRLLAAGRERRLERLEELLEGVGDAERKVLGRAVAVLRGMLGERAGASPGAVGRG